MSDAKPTPETPGTDAHVKSGLPPLPAANPDSPLLSAPIAYQPLSAWAIAGLALGSAFTLLVVLSAAVALYQGLPFFYPVWIIALPILGIVISLYGQRHVQTSEGTRVGLKQAQWGLRLSLVSGLVYFSYYYVTEFALQRQANAFVMEKGEGWDAGYLPRLQEGGEDPVQLNAAFLLTQPPSARAGRPDNESSMRKNHDITGKDGESGQLSQFREGDLLAKVFFKKLGKESEVTHLGMQDWRAEKRSYMVFHAYHIKTKEVEMQFVLAVYSVEAESAGQSRKWFVNLRESKQVPNTMKLTDIGEGMVRLRKSAGDWLIKKGEEWNAGAPFDAIREKNFDQTPWEVLEPQDGKHLERRERVHQAIAGPGTQRLPQFGVLTLMDRPGSWEQTTDGKIRVYHMFRFAVPTSPTAGPIFHVEGVAGLETKQMIDPAKFAEGSRVDWNLVNIRLTTVSVPSEKKEKTPPPQKIQG